jgi:hypothetical protein
VTTGRVDLKSNDLCLFSLPASCIRRLIFGVHFNEDARDAIVRSIRDAEKLALAHVELNEAHLGLGEYGLEIRPLRPGGK